jgi:long-chain acyl-CoA synthetase
MDDKQKQEYFSSVIVTVNKFLSPFERILEFRLIDRPFDDEHGELTPKHTYKRKVVEKNFSELIDSMYVKNHTLVYIKNTEIRVPNWFLREKGSLSRDIITNDNSILIPKLKLSLKFSQTKEQKVYRIGSHNYLISTPFIDLQTILTDPLLWIGNTELVEFAGTSIIQWYRQTGESAQIKFHSPASKPVLNESMIKVFRKISSYNEISLEGIHLAYTIILSGSDIESVSPMNYFREILDDPKNLHYRLVLNLISRPNITSNTEIKRELFTEAVKRASDKQFGEIFSYYFENDPSVLNPVSTNRIVESLWSEAKINFIESFIAKKVEQTTSIKNETIINSLFNLIVAYGVRHPLFYRRGRRFLMRFAVLAEESIIRESANQHRLNLRSGFREWLGKNQAVAVDIETGEEYRWEDVLTFNEGIDPEDWQRIKNALIKTSILREAVFMFSNGLRLRLDDILPGGIWVSLLEAKKEKSIYRMTVQTRYQGSFDVTLHLNKNLPPLAAAEEVKWLILSGTNLKGERLLTYFGGYWEEYDLWTEAFVPRESVARYLERETKRKDSEYELRLRELWPFFVWNAASAYMSFWKLTKYKYELTNPLPENITIPFHDYQTGTLLYSVSKRIRSESASNFFLRFHDQFVKKTLDKYTFLEKKSIWNYILSGITECEGELKAVELIKKFREEVSSLTVYDDKQDILFRIDEFIKSLKEDGFVPKSLFFAIKRFHRWRNLNPDANLDAQAEMLYELYETYRLFELESNYPSTRTMFFLRTVFSNAKDNLAASMKEIARVQRTGEISKDEVNKLYSDLHNLPGLTEAEEFFLTRLSYPYLKPKDTAALLKAGSFGVDSSNLVVQVRDEEDNPFIIRNPVTPKEISKLHALYLESNLAVNFKPEHKFLVALSERGFIIGGLYYSQTDENTAHMEKIVVSSRYRRKGISEALMNELFNRLKAEHFKFVTTGFFRPEYFYKFGFKIEKKYSGLVKEL